MLFEIEIALAGIAIFFPLVLSFPLASWLKIRQLDLVMNINFITFIIFALLFPNNPTTLHVPGFFAYQEVNLACFLTAMQSIVLMLVFWITTWFFPFKGILISYYLGSLVSGIICLILFFKKRGWAFRWIPVKTQIRYVRLIAQRSLEYFVHSMCAIIIANVNTVLAGSVAGLSSAGDFDLVKKIFNFFVTAHLALLTPLVHIFTQAAQLGRWDSIARKFSFYQYRIWPLLFIGGCGLVYLPR